MKKKVNLIGILGHAQDGKDTVSQIIQYLIFRYNNKDYIKEFTPINRNGSGWENKKFADKLKIIAGILLGVHPSKFEDNEYKNSLLPKEWQDKYGCYPNGTDGALIQIYSKRTVRWFLQNLGTDAIRNNIHKDCWVNALFADYERVAINWDNDGNTTESEYPRWIISDLRFSNELLAISNRNGITIRKLGKSQTTSIHPSEIELDGIEADFTIPYYEDLNDLIAHIKSILIELNIIEDFNL